jgi:hypothetical protein
MNVEQVDLAELTAALERVFGGQPVEGAIVGRTRLRDGVASHLGCSSLEAEQLVDTLVTCGFLRLERTAEGAELWRFLREA